MIIDYNIKKIKRKNIRFVNIKKILIIKIISET